MTDTPGRLLRLLSLLQQRTLWTGPELSERLEVTTRTVRRDVDRQDWRTLRVDRITSVVATGHHFHLEDPPDAGALVSRASGVSPYRYVARVVVEAPPDVVTTKVPPTVGVVESHRRGSLVVVGADDLAFLAGHLVALDLPFEALDPPELRDLLRRAGARLVAAH
jgi:predicted DNA-binding transcriptional regulator YafY